MPNWCNNRLTVYGDPKEVASLVEAAEGPDQYYARCEWEDEEFDPKKHAEENPSVFSFHQLVPLPDTVVGGPYDPYGYEAEAAFWGVKWGASNSLLVKNKGSFVEYTFSTPWAPPRDFLIRVSKRFPGLVFALSYVEELPTSGRMAMKAGEVLDEDDFPIEDWYEQAREAAKRLVPPDDEDDTDWDLFQEKLDEILDNQVWGPHDDWCSELAEAHG